ncbi:MAG: TIGR02300 family protein [Hyphomicrobiales bacterium]
MVKPELGTKRTCPSCAAKFYDLLKEPIECPICEFTFVAEPLLPSKNDTVSKPKAKPEAKPEKTEDDAEIEVVSLEDVEEGDDAEDPDIAAVAEIEDVEVDDDADPDADSDKFLEDDDEGSDDVSGIIGGVKPGGDEV